MELITAMTPVLPLHGDRGRGSELPQFRSRLGKHADADAIGVGVLPRSVPRRRRRPDPEDQNARILHVIEHKLQDCPRVQTGGGSGNLACHGPMGR